MPALQTIANSPDPRVLATLQRIQAGFLATSALLASACLLATALHGAAFVPPWLPTSIGASLAALACTVGLAICTHLQPRTFTWAGVFFGFAAIAAVLFSAFPEGLPVHWLRAVLVPASYPARPDGFHVPTAAGFMLIAILLPLLGARGGILGSVADALVSLLAFDSLCIFGRSVLVGAHIFPTPPGFRPVPSILVLLLLTFVAFLYRAQYGIFAPIVGDGFGGKMARILMPVLLLLPFLRESVRERFLNTFHVPEHAAAAALASSAASLSILFLIYIAHRISVMEAEIRDLSLRDELTGLLNLRGFRLLADQAIRMARRSSAPFSVLYVDLDHLKKINDSLGHDIGSEFLTETARLLQATFRESDVIGRIGGDEFAVAGQFDRAEIAAAVERLQLAIRKPIGGHIPQVPLSLSLGCATSEDPNAVQLEELLQDADLAMYAQKRARKHSTAFASAARP